MSYNPAVLMMVSYGPIAVGTREWRHTSADAGSAVQVSGFITDGGSRGMKVGDVLRHTDTGTNIVTAHRVMTVSSTYPGAVDLSDATTDVSGTNSN